MKRNIRLSFWQGMIKVFILHEASRNPIYGGRLAKLLDNLGHTISPGSLYPTLHNLEQAGFLRSHLKVFKGRVRRYYQITPEGRSCFAEIKESLADVVKTIFQNELPSSYGESNKDKTHSINSPALKKGG